MMLNSAQDGRVYTLAEDILVKFVDPSSGFSVLVDDDGRVAYAYLLDRNGKIVGDVWLYNCCGIPEAPEWIDRDASPYANPQGFAKSHDGLRPIFRESDIAINWREKPDGSPIASILLHGRLWAVMEPAAMLGWCIMAAKDGPLARTMDSAPACD